ncbi:hypothetical protein HHK36_016590 [Tetracentron sinense]|uniref:Transducin/WD40 repeat-like superfamily protein n=1 Tax=Tetracentron sinense TaxID=13715 RepID=A0A835DEU0_TETSI|nr:hypothetical protein HHK36_016590 [Tetracentron sinense]
MINGSGNGVMSSSSTNAQSPGLKTYFKTPEGRYKLQYEKTHPTGLLHYAHGKSVTQVTLAHLKDKPAPVPTAPASSLSASSGVRLAAARLLGAGNGSRALSFVGGNGASKSVAGASRIGSLGASSTNNSPAISNYDGKGTFLIFNVGDTIFVSDFNSQDKDPLKSINFSNSNPTCHAFDPEAKDGHDLLIGLHSGDVYSVSLRQQLQDGGKKLVGAQHYNKDGSVNNRQYLNSSSVFLTYNFFRCTSIAWAPEGDGSFVVAHADGNLYVARTVLVILYSPLSRIKLNFLLHMHGPVRLALETFPLAKTSAISLADVGIRENEMFSNPIARWHICQGSINSIAFSTDGTYLATVGRDGYLRVFDYSKEQLICGGKSYYGALLCCAWSVPYFVLQDDKTLLKESIIIDISMLFLSMDGKYILTGGEDDLVQVWSMEDRKVVAWGEGHNSWVNFLSNNQWCFFFFFFFLRGEVGMVVLHALGWMAFRSVEWLLTRIGHHQLQMPQRKMSCIGLVLLVSHCNLSSCNQDTQLLLWDVVMDEIVVPLRRCPPGGSPTYSTGSQSSHWDSICPVGTLQPAPSMRDVPKLSPLAAHRVHTEPLSGLIFTQESVLTVCREGHVKIWMRPGYTESQSSNSQTLLSTNLKEKPLLSGKVGSSNYKQYPNNHQT